MRESFYVEADLVNHFSTISPFSGYMLCDTWIRQAPIVTLMMSAIQIIFMYNYPLCGGTCCIMLVL